MVRKTRHQKNLSESGFTIIEFLIATTVFTLVLLVCSYAIIHVGKMYYKGVITNRTQDTARRIVEDVANAIQYSPNPDSGRDFYMEDGNSYCIGNDHYTVNPNVALGVDGVLHVLWRDALCSEIGNTPADLTLSIPTEGGQELVGKNMRITNFDIQEPALGSNLWTVSVRVSYGDNDALFDDPGTYRECKGANAGGQFCAVSEFTTSVTRRLGGD